MNRIAAVCCAALLLSVLLPTAAFAQCTAPPGTLSGIQDAATSVCFQQAIAAFVGDVTKYHAAKFTATSLPIFARVDTGDCLVRAALGALSDRLNGVSPAIIQARLTNLRQYILLPSAADPSKLANCVIRWTCGFSPSGTRILCDEAQRRSAANELAADLQCALNLIGDLDCTP